MDLKVFTEKLKVKNLERNQIFILFLCGILLMIIAIPEKDKKDTENIYVTEEGGNLNRNVSTDSTVYAQYLEKELEEMLVQMEGVGEAVCMVTLSQSAEQVIEKDLDISDENVTESDSQGGSRTTNQSSRTETTIYNEGENGSPYVRTEISPKVEGVLVIAEGADNSVAVKNITEGIQALFGIESHKIRIVKKEGVNH